MDVILAAIEPAGYRPGVDVVIALDPAAWEFFDKAQGNMSLKKATAHAGTPRDGRTLPGLWARYPIVSLEDGMGEGDWDGWVALTKELGSKLQLVGDDIFVTNVQYLQKASNWAPPTRFSSS